MLTFSYFRPKFLFSSSLPSFFFFFLFRVFQAKFKGGEEDIFLIYIYKKYVMDRYVYHDIFKFASTYMTSCGGIGARNERIAENSI